MLLLVMPGAPSSVLVPSSKNATCIPLIARVSQPCLQSLLLSAYFGPFGRHNCLLFALLPESALPFSPEMTQLHPKHL